VIDSPVLPDELDALPSVLEQAGFPVSGLLATHGDWDHLLGRLAFPEAALAVGESTARRLAAEPGGAQRALRAFDEEHYVTRPRPLALAGVQELPVPGRLSIGPAGEIELHPTAGHTPDGVAFWLPWAQVLVCGDYLSPVEIPMVESSAGEYAATLDRLEPLVREAASVVPGHGAPLSRSEALRILEEDRVYTQALVGGEPRLPEGRRSAHQRSIHAENLARRG
jgi:glyoxylase-like metal-dependent hydrolase (beta-lactamase superfamily II)